jgi:hypothetical protein
MGIKCPSSGGGQSMLSQTVTGTLVLLTLLFVIGAILTLAFEFV